MPTALKKILAAFLLVLILAPLSYMFIFQAKQLSIQRRMKKELESSLVQTVVLPASKLIWVKPDKEILLDQKMFDIKTISYNADGNVCITGLFDHLETGLLTQMKKSWQQDNGLGCKLIVQLLQVITILQQDNTTDFSPQILTAEKTARGKDCLPSPFTQILTPPPQA